ncbi:MAG: HlyD family secretion protein [Prevotellaceae bacterium]|jgi:HlyD family secretion protein|nr:HlyD family secretion protein [Prevotellaceae bacterium]
MHNNDNTHSPKSPDGNLGVRSGVEIELRSEEIRDILTHPPHILVRSGISVICAVIVLLFVGSFFFKYPDIVTGNVVITTENPPVWLVAKATGKIKELNCLDKSKVTEGQVLAVIENPAVTKDVNKIKASLVQCIIADSTLFLPPGLLHTNYELGNIQNIYSAFVRTATNYENFLFLSATQKEKEALNLQITGHRNYAENLHKQLALKQEELKIAQSTYERETQLYKKGVSSKAEMEIAENAWLSVRQSLQQLQTSIASDEIELGQLKESVSKLEVQYLREKNSLLSELKTAYNELLSGIENWEQVYLLISPVSGQVTFNSFWTSNQFVNSGDKVLAVVPYNPGEIIGRMQSPAFQSGKIEKGQRVNIKLSGYPYMEYGALQGKIRNISLLPDENNYSIDIELPEGLKTNTGKILHFTGELTGQAEIITDNRSLFSRILSPLRYLLDKHTVR